MPAASGTGPVCRRAGGEVAHVQIGADHQDQFIDWAERELLPALRSL
jgi:hypothetical protein